jgi:Zn-dependent membrane protease YugP
MIFVILGALFVALAFVPQILVRQTMMKHGGERPDMPGTGGELARHLLDEADLHSVKVEITPDGDHYDPVAKAVRLSRSNYEGRSITAAAVAAHEAAHAVQDKERYAPFAWRQRLVGHVIFIERAGSIVLLATPVVFALLRAPSILIVELIAGLAILASTVVIHLVTLPTEFDASFKRALPVLEFYLKPQDMPGAHSVLRAAAFTYVSAALSSLLNIGRWLRILRF